MSDTYMFDFWLAFEKPSTGSSRKTTPPRVTKNAPSLAGNERAMQCRVEVPRALFERPSLKATITVADDQPQTRVEIDLEAAAESLSQAVGLPVELTVITPGEGGDGS